LGSTTEVPVDAVRAASTERPKAPLTGLDYRLARARTTDRT
jgi:hypothetical protein